MTDFDKVIQGCKTLLQEYPGAYAAKDYLAGRLPTIVWDKFGFGFYPSEDKMPALLSLVNEQVLLKSKLRYERFGNDGIYRKVKHNFFEHHNLIMPYRDVYGNIVAIVGRTIYKDSKIEELGIPRYKNSSFEKKNHVYGLYEAKRRILEKDCVFVVEGQFDAIMAHARGIENIVALGSSAMTMYQLGLILRYTKNIFLIMDNDEAGIIGAEKIIDRFNKLAKFTNKTLPFGYKDLDDFLRDNDKTTDLDLIRM